MRKHEILVDGKSYKVQLEACTIGAPFSVKVNEKDLEVRITREPDFKTPFSVTVKGKSYTVELERIDRKLTFPIKVNQVPFNIQFKTAEREVARIPTPSVTALAPKALRKTAKEGEILAPMAGKIVSVKVGKGDNRRKQHSDGDDVAQHGNRNIDQFLPGVGPVDRSRLIEICRY